MLKDKLQGKRPEEPANEGQREALQALPCRSLEELRVTYIALARRWRSYAEKTATAPFHSRR